jgi:5S rRNA maturation endonuclease (ribonuclease M5)
MRRLWALENRANVHTIVTRYKVVGFRHEVDSWIVIKSIHKLSNLHEILILTDFDSTEKAKAFRKMSKYWE